MAAVRTIPSDCLTFLILGLTAILLKFGNVEPFHRGFYCYDSSIRHPYKVNNVEDTTVEIYQTVPPSPALSRAPWHWLSVCWSP